MKNDDICSWNNKGHEERQNRRDKDSPRMGDIMDDSFNVKESDT